MLYFIALFFLAVSASFAAVIPRSDESSAANAYSGNSGSANGGNSTTSGFQLISVLSNNGGDGGNTPTGPSFAQSGGSSTPREDTKRQRDSKEAKPNPASLPALFEEDC